MIQDDDDGWCEKEAIPREKKKIEQYVFNSFYLMHVRMKVHIWWNLSEHFFQVWNFLFRQINLILVFLLASKCVQLNK
jgi:hypothetical protein